MSDTDPDYRQVDIPLVRARDKVPVGNLKLIRTRTWLLYDENGRRLAVPKHQDTLIVTLARPSAKHIVLDSVAVCGVLGHETGRPGEHRKRRGNPPPVRLSCRVVVIAERGTRSDRPPCVPRARSRPDWLTRFRFSVWGALAAMVGGPADRWTCDRWPLRLWSDGQAGPTCNTAIP